MSGCFSDRFGRKPALVLSSLFQIINCLLFYICSSYSFLLILRIGLGICFGLGLPLTTTTMVEHLPVRNRGRWIVCINFFITIGKLLGVLLGYLFLDNLSSGNWRLMITVTSVFPLFTFLGTILFIRESPRFCLFNDQASKCYSILKTIQKINFSCPSLVLYIDNDQPLHEST